MSDWTRTRISHDGTHHVLDGEPLYADRFSEVLKFHAPGLAPVRVGDEAWHIRTNGEPAYDARFNRTFGFYEERAAVRLGAEWSHILSDGSFLYPTRYVWCGNYQGGRCPVRREDLRYVHLDLTGNVVGSAWRYAGDYRDGVAVVQRDDGQSTHVDLAGELIHERWFLDLDVPHKGLARARDDRGWMHVDARGAPLYVRRFAAVEPHYNGQARVERFDGAVEVIDEAGETLVELRPALRDPFHELSADLVGHWRTDTIAAAVHLGVLEALPGPTPDVATTCGIPVSSARRLLQALAELQVVAADNATWRTTKRGALLTREHPETLADAAVEYAGPLRTMWSSLTKGLRDPDAPRHNFFTAVATSDRRDGHHRMLRSYAIHDYSPLIEHLPIQPGEVVIDAGGGTGALAALIADHWEDCRAVLMDLPEVIASADVPPAVERMGVDLFEPWPASADVIILARVLHDWEDDRAEVLLRRARAALRPGGRLIVIEMLLGPNAGALCDLHLLAVTGGRERSLEGYESLLAGAGLRVTHVIRTPGIPQMLVATAPHPDWPAFVPPLPAGFPTDGPRVLLMRHAARPPIPRGESGHDLALTPDGIAAAQHLGAVLPPGFLVRSSPIRRCVETAAALGCPDPVLDQMLGDPTAFIHDPDLAWQNWLAIGHDGIIDHILHNRPMPGFRDYRTAAEDLVRHLAGQAEAHPDHPCLCVTHDWVLTAALRFLTGIAIAPDEFPTWLECVGMWRSRSGWRLGWRDREWPVDCALP
ncbi:MAG: methyltransferase [Vicinamibacterales bacterium]